MEKNKRTGDSIGSLVVSIIILFPLILLLVYSKVVETNRQSGKENKDESDLGSNLVVDQELIGQKIEQGKEYLLRMIDAEVHGVHKYYYPLDDHFEERLHTIYTSSTLSTLLKIYDFNQDKSLLKQVSDGGEFILFMQNRNKSSKDYGAFHYSYFLDTKEKEKRFVVGTTAKTIFTLLELSERTGDSKYLESARLGADWLITMQNPDGSIKPYGEDDDGRRVDSTKESHLYNGQVLSALSRIYSLTGKQEYYDLAEKIGQRFLRKIEAEGCYLGDDYRPKNPISSSWAILSLSDFYKVSQDGDYEETVFVCSDELLERQINDEGDLFNYGRWRESSSTSGNGWLAEVMVEIYKFCKEQNKEGCDKYKEATTRAMRWLLQRTYSEENSASLKNPERAIGGIFWNQKNRYVRTDSVCHGLNAYVGIIEDSGEGTLPTTPK